jgi:hypothetical protein
MAARRDRRDADALVWVNQCNNVVAHDGDAEIALLAL